MLPLRPNVCLLILNKERNLFLGQRSGASAVWQFPQGGVEHGSLEENALREAHEEMGVDLNLLRVLQKLSATHEYDFANPPEYARGVWRGQSQTFWLLEFLGVDADIKLDRFEPEFSSFAWCPPAEVLGRVEERRRKGYEAPLREVVGLLEQGLFPSW
jgi:putative (di)nucleoside polyphosphate hydrolase